jgi:heme-degrading monooxygenase HmoA
MFDRKTGKRISVTLWESEQALQAGDAAAKLLRAGAPASLEIIDVEQYVIQSLGVVFSTF